MNFSLVGECKYVNNVKIFRDSAYLLRELNFFQWGNYPSLFLLFFYYNEIYVYSLKNSFLLKKNENCRGTKLPCFSATLLLLYTIQSWLLCLNIVWVRNIKMSKMIYKVYSFIGKTYPSMRFFFRNYFVKRYLIKDKYLYKIKYSDWRVSLIHYFVFFGIHLW